MYRKIVEVLWPLSMELSGCGAEECGSGTAFFQGVTFAPQTSWGEAANAFPSKAPYCHPEAWLQLSSPPSPTYCKIRNLFLFLDSVHNLVQLWVIQWLCLQHFSTTFFWTPIISKSRPPQKLPAIQSLGMLVWQILCGYLLWILPIHI